MRKGQSIRGLIRGSGPNAYVLGKPGANRGRWADVCGAKALLTDVAARPLSTTVARYQRLHLSRRKGNAIRQDLSQAGLIEPVAKGSDAP